MSKYRKLPVEIEAFRFGIEFVPDWFMDKVSTNEITLHEKPNELMHCVIRTLEGNMRGEYGDYIIKGVNGEIYPCKPDIFEKTYEKVEE